MQVQPLDRHRQRQTDTHTEKMRSSMHFTFLWKCLCFVGLEMRGSSYVVTTVWFLVPPVAKCSEVMQIKFPTCFELHGQWFFSFQGKVPLHSIHSFICFACSDILSVGIFNRHHITKEHEKPLQNLCSSHCLLSNSYILELSVAFVPCLKQNFMYKCCTLQSAIF
jgi:hypothetical protein